jgi:hypothetical protein
MGNKNVEIFWSNLRGMGRGYGIKEGIRQRYKGQNEKKKEIISLEFQRASSTTHPQVLLTNCQCQ